MYVMDYKILNNKNSKVVIAWLFISTALTVASCGVTAIFGFRLQQKSTKLQYSDVKWDRIGKSTSYVCRIMLPLFTVMGLVRLGLYILQAIN